MSAAEKSSPSGRDDERGGEKFSEPGALFYERAAACAAAVSERSRAATAKRVSRRSSNDVLTVCKSAARGANS